MAYHYDCGGTGYDDPKPDPKSYLNKTVDITAKDVLPAIKLDSQITNKIVNWMLIILSIASLYFFSQYDNWSGILIGMGLITFPLSIILNNSYSYMKYISLMDYYNSYKFFIASSFILCVSSIGNSILLYLGLNSNLEITAYELTHLIHLALIGIVSGGCLGASLYEQIKYGKFVKHEEIHARAFFRIVFQFIRVDYWIDRLGTSRSSNDPNYKMLHDIKCGYVDSAIKSVLEYPNNFRNTTVFANLKNYQEIRKNIETQVRVIDNSLPNNFQDQIDRY